MLDAFDFFSQTLMGRESSYQMSYKLELETFIDCVQENLKLEPGLEDGIMALKVADTIRISIKNEGEEVPIDE